MLLTHYTTLSVHVSTISFVVFAVRIEGCSYVVNSGGLENCTLSRILFVYGLRVFAFVRHSSCVSFKQTLTTRTKRKVD